MVMSLYRWLWGRMTSQKCEMCSTLSLPMYAFMVLNDIGVCVYVCVCVCVCVCGLLIGSVCMCVDKCMQEMELQYPTCTCTPCTHM